MVLRDLRQELLNKLGGEPYKFVVKIDSDEIEIIESKNQGKGKENRRHAGTLRKVTIHRIPTLDFIWQINVEKKRVRVISYRG